MRSTFRCFGVTRFRLVVAAPSIMGLAIICGSLVRASQVQPQVIAVQKPAAATTSVVVPGDATQGVAQMKDLLDSLLRFDQNGRLAGQKIGFELPERTINEYLAYILRQKSRPGIASASVTLLGSSELAGVAEIDFDAVRDWNANLVPERLRPVLTGRQTLRVNARFESQNGSVKFTVTNAQGPNGMTIPTAILTAVIQEIGRRQPEALEAGKPIPLPYGLKRVWINRRTLCGET